jgi:hypothetical protein
MFVYVCIHIYIYTHLFLHIFTFMNKYILLIKFVTSCECPPSLGKKKEIIMNINEYMYLCLHMYVYLYLYLYVWIYIYKYILLIKFVTSFERPPSLGMCICIYMCYLYTCIHIYVYVYIWRIVYSWYGAIDWICDFLWAPPQSRYVYMYTHVIHLLYMYMRIYYM